MKYTIIIVLKEWFTAVCPKIIFPFKTIEYVETNSWNNSTADFLSALIRENTVDEEFLKYMKKKLKWDWKKIYTTFVIESQPSHDNLKKGKFGEIFHGQILEEFYNYVIPVKKFQYQFNRNQSLTGTDIIVIKIKEAKITEICYVETKLRTSSDYSAISEAYDEIIQSKGSSMDSTLKFILKELYKTDKILHSQLTEFIGEMTHDDKFRIGAIFEKKIWRQRYIEKLNDCMQELDLDLTVDIVKINNLKELVNNSYKAIGK